MTEAEREREAFFAGYRAAGGHPSDAEYERWRSNPYRLIAALAFADHHKDTDNGRD